MSARPELAMIGMSHRIEALMAPVALHNSCVLAIMNRSLSLIMNGNNCVPGLFFWNGKMFYVCRD